MIRLPSAEDELLRALRVNFVNFAGMLSVEQAVSRSWCSITYSGARHRVTLLLEGAGARDSAVAFLCGLDEREFALKGHIVADIVGDMSEVGGDRVRLSLEALTVESA